MSYKRDVGGDVGDHPANNGRCYDLRLGKKSDGECRIDKN